MSKFTFEEKLCAVQSYLNGEGGYKTIAQQIGTVQSTIIKWVMLFEHHGIDGLMKSYTNYSAEFKLNVLNYMNEHRTSLYETAAIFKIPSPYTITKWKITLEKAGIDALESKLKGRPSMKKETKKATPAEGSVEALQAENERLRMENAYLKKLNALVQEKEALRRKTKRK